MTKLPASYITSFIRVLKDRLILDIRHGIRFNIDLEVYMEFMAGGILRIIYAWLKEGQKRSVEDLTREVVKIINGIRETHIKKF